MKNNNYLIAAVVQSALAFSVPSLAFAGDVEIQLPAATDAFTVDQPVGTELMRVHGDGNVGIGTATPAARLDILGESSGSIILRDGDAAINEPGHQAGLQLYDGSGNRTGVVGFSTSFEGIAIRNFNDDGGISLSTGGNANQLVVAADGNVGINTIVPSDGTSNGGQALKLDVEGAVGASHYCDQNGENCLTAAELVAGSSGGGGVLSVGEVTGTTEASLTASFTITQDAVLVARGESRANHDPASQSNKSITSSLQIDGASCGSASSFAYINNATWQTEATCIKELAAGTYNLELLNNLSTGGTRVASKLQYVVHAKAGASGGASGGGTQKQYLDEYVLIDHLNNAGTQTNAQLNFDLSTVSGVTVPEWATHAIVMGRAFVSQSGAFSGSSNSAQIRLSHNGTNLVPFAYASAYGGSGQADRSDDSNTQEVRIRNGNLIGFESATSDGGNTGQIIQAQLYLVGFAGY